MGDQDRLSKSKFFLEAVEGMYAFGVDVVFIFGGDAGWDYGVTFMVVIFEESLEASV